MQKRSRSVDAEFCFKVDADFENVKRAWVEITSLVKKWVDEKGENPLSVTMECRFTAHSDIPLSPAYGKPGDHFCWMEVRPCRHTVAQSLPNAGPSYTASKRFQLPKLSFRKELTFTSIPSFASVSSQIHLVWAL
jgi:hypothetical protein